MTGICRFIPAHTQSDMAREAASYLVRVINQVMETRETVAISLAGGSSPVETYHLLAQEQVDWHRIHIFWGDERMVPLDHADSNHAMTQKALISSIDIPAHNIHPVPVHVDDGPAAASAYEQEIRDFFQQGPPVIDIMILGMGTDGHTASLYPGQDTLKEKNKLVVHVPQPGMPPEHPRVSLTLGLINSSRHVIFIAGKGKAHLVDMIMGDHQDTHQWPSAMVQGKESCTWFYVDDKATS